MTQTNHINGLQCHENGYTSLVLISIIMGHHLVIEEMSLSCEEKSDFYLLTFQYPLPSGIGLTYPSSFV